MTRIPARLLMPALLVAMLAVTGCTAGDEGTDSGGAGNSTSQSEAQSGALSDHALADQNLSDQDGAADAAATDKVAAPVAARSQALIRTGTVALRAEDVAQARNDVQKVADRHAGQVADEESQSDDEGRAAFTRMVLRVPSQDFQRAVDEIKGVADLESSTTTQDDVTSEVIDVQTRVKVQKRSIARISVLFQQARGIRDIMAIEAELSQRQADLESLEQQAAHLADQTSLSTITVSIDQIPDKARTAPDDQDDAGFLTGLRGGWGALSTFAVGLATVVGALLPWLAVLGLVGVPTLLLVRSLRRRTPAPRAPQSSE